VGLIETETTTVVDPKEEPPRAVHGYQQGWLHTSADRQIHRAVLVNRLQRTGFDIPMFLADVDLDSEEGAEPPGIAGASGCALAGASLLHAQEHFDEGRPEHARLALDSAEGYLAQALLTLHLLRIQISAGGLQ
jgi:hypothetical protein